MSLKVDPPDNFVQYVKDNPREHWPGRKYPEYELLDEADNLPGSAEQAGYEQLHESEDFKPSNPETDSNA